MLFTSGIFWLYYLFVISLLLINSKKIKSVNFQNIILLLASYIFYSYWDYRFLFLIIFVSFQTFICGYFIYKFTEKKESILFLSLLINIMILAYFKYAGFFVSEFSSLLGNETPSYFENIILPVGISFYIFQSFTYVLDIYNEQIKPEKNLINYFTFIAFFPQLVAGPIERASSLLPQFRFLKTISYKSLVDGLKLIIIGLFLKVFIADNLSYDVDYIFSNYQTLNNSTLILGAIGFSSQIYGDFCGYSLIAIGISQIIGFKLTNNFDAPYFSSSLKEFWRKWHITLSSFFRDYFYIPIGGSKKSFFYKCRNLIFTFLLSGLWHGANWTFILWGFLHGLFLILENILPIKINKFLNWLITMFIVFTLWILFRSESVNDFLSYLNIIISGFPKMPETGQMIILYFLYCLLLESILLKFKNNIIPWFNSKIIENFLLSIMLVLVIGTIAGSKNFIYFQF